MENEILDATELTDEDEPMTPDEQIATLITDIALDNAPDEVASEIIENFLLVDRAETPYIAAMIDAPAAEIVDLLKQVVAAAYEGQVAALDARGVLFIEGLKSAVKMQLEKMANNAD
jgi:hypothetical protein